LQVTVRNPEKGVAFMVHLRVARREGGEDVTPILWDDNYFSLLPGEERTVGATFASGASEAGETLEVGGFNVVTQEVAPAGR
jgi:exo-1,4-beta-D-glucosaminidase